MADVENCFCNGNPSNRMLLFLAFRNRATYIYIYIIKNEHQFFLIERIITIAKNNIFKKNRIQ